MDNEKWLIWSNEHEAWWKPNGNGYTNDRSLAGLYSLSDAIMYLKSANFGLSSKCKPNEAIVAFDSFY